MNAALTMMIYFSANGPRLDVLWFGLAMKRKYPLIVIKYPVQTMGRNNIGMDMAESKTRAAANVTVWAPKASDTAPKGPKIFEYVT